MRLDPDSLLAILGLAIPAIAIIGAFAVAIVRILAERRTMELAQRERIAAIERGIDPSKLPPLGQGSYGPGGHVLDRWGYRNGSSLRRAHGLLIGGLVTFAAGIGISLFFRLMETQKNAWSIGLIPMLVGAALLAGSAVIWPRGGGGAQAPPAPTP